MDTNSNKSRELLGKILGNLQSLEFALRAVLYENESEPHYPLDYGKNLNDLSEGDIVPENAMTDYSSLGQLIDRFNSEIADGDNRLMVDQDLLKLRDALAHGRVSSKSESGDLVLIKFDRPKNNTVKVSYVQKMTKDWLKAQVKKIYEQTKMVIGTLNS